MEHQITVTGGAVTLPQALDEIIALDTSPDLTRVGRHVFQNAGAPTPQMLFGHHLSFGPFGPMQGVITGMDIALDSFTAIRATRLHLFAEVLSGIGFTLDGGPRVVNTVGLQHYMMSQSWHYDGSDEAEIEGHDATMAGGTPFEPAGDDVFNMHGGDDVIYAGAGDDVVRGGHGDDVIEGGEGDDLLKGGMGHDTLVFSRGDGRDEVIGYRPEADTLDFSGYGKIQDVDDLIARSTTDGENTTVHLGHDDRIVFLDFPDPEDFRDGTFLF